MRDDSQPPFLAQHRVAMLEQCCNHSKQCRNNVTTVYCDKNRPGESSRLTSPLAAKATITAKKEGLISKKQLCTYSTLFCTFFCHCFARLQRETPRNFLVTRFMGEM